MVTQGISSRPMGNSRPSRVSRCRARHSVQPSQTSPKRRPRSSRTRSKRIGIGGASAGIGSNRSACSRPPAIVRASARAWARPSASSSPIGPAAFERSPIPHSAIYEAIQEFQKVLRPSSGSRPCATSLALAHLEAGSPQQAKTEMEVDGAGLPQGQRRPAPCQPDGQCYLGIISAQVGDKGAARWALSVAAASLTPFPGQGEARKALAAIDT